MLNVVAIIGRLAASPELPAIRMPAARARQTGWTLLPGAKPQSLSANTSPKVR